MSNLKVDDITAAKNMTSSFQKVSTDSPKKDLKTVETSEPELDEPLLRENKQRFVLFPIKYNDVSFFNSSAIVVTIH
jgi:hypothetical protein